MAFTTTYLPFTRYKYFLYYADGLNTNLEENLTPAFAFEIHNVKLHLSVVHASIVDFIIRLSSHQNSAHNVTLLSVAMSDLDNYIWEPSVPYVFHSADTINFSMDCANANRFGLTVCGWAITAP